MMKRWNVGFGLTKSLHNYKGGQFLWRSIVLKYGSCEISKQIASYYFVSLRNKLLLYNIILAYTLP